LPSQVVKPFLGHVSDLLCASSVYGVIGRDGVRTTIHTAEADASFNYQLNRAGKATVRLDLAFSTYLPIGDPWLV
jgi:hypothetical protein